VFEWTIAPFFSDSDCFGTTGKSLLGLSIGLAYPWAFQVGKALSQTLDIIFGLYEHEVKAHLVIGLGVDAACHSFFRHDM
jgi:hypothetical protein